MPRFILILVLVPAVLVAGLLPGEAWPAGSITPSPNLRLLYADERGVVLELATPDYQIVPTSGFHRLTFPDYGTTSEPGKPQVPVVSALLGVPPDAQVELRVLGDDAVPLPGRFKLSPAPSPAPLSDDLQPGELVYNPDATVYADDAFYPPIPARITGDAWLRDQRIVRVELYPFQVNPAQGTLLWHRWLQVEVRFVDAQTPTPSPSPNPGGGEPNSPLSQNWERGARGERADPFEPILRRALLNYDSARAWRPQPLAGELLNLYAANPKSEIRNPKSKIVVDHDALYRLTYTDLQAAGMDVDAVDPRTFHLTSQGQDVAIYVTGEGDGRFDPDDFIVFYGQRYRGTVQAERYADEMAHWLALCPRCRLAGMLEKYTDDNVYWLTAGDTPGPRMATADGRPTDTAPVPTYYRATVHAEESHEWYTHHFSSEDTWFWDRVQTGFDPITHSYTTTLTALASDIFTATIRGEVVARNFILHDTRFLLNDQVEPLDQGAWFGKTNHTFEAQVDQSTLNEGENQLHFVTGSHLDWIYFNWFEVEYARRFQAQGDQLPFPGEESGAWQYEVEGFTDPDIHIYDVTNPLAPQRVLNPRISLAGGGYRVAFGATHDAGARYLTVAAPAVQHPKAIMRYIPPDLKSPDNGADYIIITHRQFYADVQRLAEYRASQGLRVGVVDVDDLYNEFNDGIFHPIAVRNFLAYAYANWQSPAPAYALLVGDGHWNFKGYGVERYGSPELIYMPPNLAFVDPWQGEVDSANLLAAVVGDDILPDLFVGRLPVNSREELIAAIAKTITYEQASPQDGQRHVLFVADNIPDSAGDFVGLSEDIIANHLPPGFQADRIYLNDYLGDCGAPNPPRACPTVNAAIVEQLNHTGALLVNYVGHASIDQWASERIFINGDIPFLANGDRLPVILSMTCLDGYWIYPNQPSLAEELVRAAGKGAVSTFSPTGLGVATGHHVLQRRFYDAVFQDGLRELGPATLAAKLALFASGSNYDLIHTLTIFGDPALRLGRPPSKVYLPVVQK